MEGKRYWFPAKRNGFGWGLPQVWQGWLVLAGYAAGMLGAAFLFPPSHAPVGFWIAVSILTGILVSTCILKGEPPEWRWGDR
ncbi:MAG: hypothetical protein PHO57_12160 [Acidithiobacillus sp.]|nr:hypothetical protein [Acidithiobacillus sp.]